MSARSLLAHSAPTKGAAPQEYAEHTTNVRTLGEGHADAIQPYASASSGWGMWRRPVSTACEWHDLGKIDQENQEALHAGRGKRLPHDHIDAGVAYVLTEGDEAAAWLIRGHHRPGLPSEVIESSRATFMLRGERWEGDDDSKHSQLISRNNAQIVELTVRHRVAVGKKSEAARTSQALHGLAARFALGCLVDADHTDTARFDRKGPALVSKPAPTDPRWEERLVALRQFVAKKQAEGTGAPDRNLARQSLFIHCSETQTLDECIVSCDAAVGLGKTTAVLAYLLRQAMARDLRRIIIVAPFTDILSQTARNLRNAVVLDGETPEDVILEHHHRADFEDRNLRESAVTWDAPIILTTAVQFFETLGSNCPVALRKLHRLPGSGLFIDESHAALPYRMWPQCFEWLRELAKEWNCPTVLASGSQIKFWESPWGRPGLEPESIHIEDITPEDVRVFGRQQERSRVAIESIDPPLSCEDLANLTIERLNIDRPQLAILNTVHSSAGLASCISKRLDEDTGRALRNKRTLYLSTALTPAHRERVLEEVFRRAEEQERPAWVLVATSCVEAGVDISLHDGLREDASVASTIQTSGRINRNGEWKGSRLTRFRIADDPNLTPHPDLKLSADILRELSPYLEDGQLIAKHSTAEIATEAAKREVTEEGSERSALALTRAVKANDYPKISELCRVITNKTITVVANEAIKKDLEAGARVSSRDLLRHSVQLWPLRVESLGLEQIRLNGQPMELYYASESSYDDTVLGIGRALIDSQTSII